MLAACAVLGCEGSQSSVVVLLDAQAASRSAASTLHVRVLGPDGSVRLDDTRDVGPDTGWPLRVPLVPEGGDASRGWTIEATLLDPEGASVSIARVRGRYAAGAAREVALCLFDGCAGERCGDACTIDGCSSCRAGTCADSEALLETVGTSPRCPAPGCVALGVRETVCGDLLDDDCDGRVDCLDPDCGCDAGTCVPSGPEDAIAACHDGLDNDCDGQVDCEDLPGCLLEEGPENCGNGFDDDCDGETDCFDTGCCAAPICDQQACGSGGLRCCSGRCANTWNDAQNCGGCGITCAPGRACGRPSNGSGSVEAAACRCALAAGECGARRCVEHGGDNFCNCLDDSECRGASVCVLQSGDRHDACNIPR